MPNEKAVEFIRSLLATAVVAHYDISFGTYYICKYDRYLICVDANTDNKVVVEPLTGFEDAFIIISAENLGNDSIVSDILACLRNHFGELYISVDVAELSQIKVPDGALIYDTQLVLTPFKSADEIKINDVHTYLYHINNK